MVANAKHTMKRQVVLHLLDCAKVGGIWDEDLLHPLSKTTLPKLVVAFFCGADLCDHHRSVRVLADPAKAMVD